MWKLLTHPDYATFWTAFGAIATGVAALLGVIALIYTISGFRKSLKESHYTSLDGMYMTILQMTLERPYLKAPALLSTEVQQNEYDTFAYILWNFLESIYDHCQKDPDLQATWYPTIHAESLIHLAWLETPANRSKFKEAFHLFIAEGRFEVR
jgi:hypothetical protein